jgi:hypothetical protein
VRQVETCRTFFHKKSQIVPCSLKFC